MWFIFVCGLSTDSVVWMWKRRNGHRWDTGSLLTLWHIVPVHQEFSVAGWPQSLWGLHGTPLASSLVAVFSSLGLILRHWRFSLNVLGALCADNFVSSCHVDLFCDLTKVFDTVKRKTLWAMLAKYGCSPKYVKMIWLLYDDITWALRTIHYQKGMKHGHILATVFWGLEYAWGWTISVLWDLDSAPQAY